MGYRVLTYTESDLQQACTRLEDACRAFDPDLVVGIATGGEVVAQAMFADVDHVSASCHRAVSRGRDSRLWRAIASALPRWLLDRLRIAESRLYAMMPQKADKPVHVAPEADQAIAQASRILIVDDAVDSGATLASVAKHVSAVAKPDSEIRAAAITVTRPRSIVEPDFYLFNNNTLIRFPWAMDAKP